MLVKHSGRFMVSSKILLSSYYFVDMTIATKYILHSKDLSSWNSSEPLPFLKGPRGTLHAGNPATVEGSKKRTTIKRRTRKTIFTQPLDQGSTWIVFAFPYDCYRKLKTRHIWPPCSSLLMLNHHMTDED